MKPIRVLGHPLHPVTVHLPIGILLLASGLDLIVGLGFQPEWAAHALLALQIGLLCAIVTVCAGFIDFLSIPTGGQAERTAKVHIAVMVVSLALYCGALGWRMAAGEAGWGAIALSVVGGIVLMAGGWFGGQLVYGLGQGVHGQEVVSEGVSSQDVASEKTSHKGGFRKVAASEIVVSEIGSGEDKES